MNTVKSFVRQFVAAVVGDTDTVLAEKNFRLADSALQTQIAILTGGTIKKEDAVTSAQEQLDSSRINGAKTITDPDQYVENLLRAKNNLTNAEQDLKKHKEKLDFLKGELAALSAEVEQPA